METEELEKHYARPRSSWEWKCIIIGLSTLAILLGIRFLGGCSRPHPPANLPPPARDTVTPQLKARAAAHDAKMQHAVEEARELWLERLIQERDEQAKTIVEQMMEIQRLNRALSDCKGKNAT